MFILGFTVKYEVNFIPSFKKIEVLEIDRQELKIYTFRVSDWLETSLSLFYQWETSDTYYQIRLYDYIIKPLLKKIPSMSFYYSYSIL